jgi:hypothetical protein
MKLWGRKSIMLLSETLAPAFTSTGIGMPSISIRKSTSAELPLASLAQKCNFLE